MTAIGNGNGSTELERTGSETGSETESVTAIANVIAKETVVIASTGNAIVARGTTANETIVSETYHAAHQQSRHRLEEGKTQGIINNHHLRVRRRHHRLPPPKLGL